MVCASELSQDLFVERPSPTTNNDMLVIVVNGTLLIILDLIMYHDVDNHQQPISLPKGR